MNRIDIPPDKRRKLKKLLNKHRTFDAFSSNKNDAYQYTELLGAIVCPYCNMNYIHTVMDVVRPDIDHFQSRLSAPNKKLSVENLIPACLPCNMRVKFRQKFTARTHLNPLRDSFDEIKRFSISLHVPDLKSINDFDIILVDRPGIERKRIKRADNNAKALKLMPRYQLHKPEVLELINMARFYNQAKVRDIQTLTQRQGIRKWLFADLYRSVANRPLGKLRKDISQLLLK